MKRTLFIIVSCMHPDSMTMLGHRWNTRVDFVGPTLVNYVGLFGVFFWGGGGGLAHGPNVGPTGMPNVWSAGRTYVGPTCLANVRLSFWTDVRPMSNKTSGHHSLPKMAH